MKTKKLHKALIRSILRTEELIKQLSEENRHLKNTLWMLAGPWEISDGTVKSFPIGEDKGGS